MDKKRLVLVGVVGLLFFMYSKSKAAFADSHTDKSQEQQMQHSDRVTYIDLNSGVEKQEVSLQEYNSFFQPGGKLHQYAPFKPDFAQLTLCEQFRNREAQEIQCLHRYIQELMKAGRENLARDSFKK